MPEPDESPVIDAGSLAELLSNCIFLAKSQPGRIFDRPSLRICYTEATSRIAVYTNQGVVLDAVLLDCPDDSKFGFLLRHDDVTYRVLAYEPGEWECKVDTLSQSHESGYDFELSK